MRVLLFVQSGDTRPTVRWTGTSAKRVAACYARDEARNAAFPNHADRVPPYWLVECENADAGRLIIACSRGDCDSPEGCVCRQYGRILASGGKP